MKNVGFTETVLRDANQSLIATRLPFEKFEKILPVMDEAGYYSVECWGGATFDSCLRYLDEDPWERLRKIRAAMPKTKLQMLLRGRNLLGYRHYSDDVVGRFVRKSVENGVDIIRIFDALNDLDNVKTAVEATLSAGAVASGAVAYTVSPVHTAENYVSLCRELRQMGCGTLCIKDMAGVLTPSAAGELVSAVKDALPDTPLVLHTHCTTGMAYMTVMAAAQAGCDVIDTAVSAFSGGASQPATETLDIALREAGAETGLNSEKLREINAFFKPLRDEYARSGLLKIRALATDGEALSYKVPGGMLSNMMANLEELGVPEKLEAALKEIPEVRRDLGYPPLVTPMSQMVGTQAVANVISGERYKSVSREIKAYLRGEYGKAPGEVNEALKEKVLGGEQGVGTGTEKTPEFEEAKAEIGALAESEEDVLSYALFPGPAGEFFKKREKKRSRTVQYTVERVE